MFEPIRTERLLLRSVLTDDAVSVAARRSDAETARYQGWEVPYPLERARAMVDAVVSMSGPAKDEWFMIAIADPETERMIGDLAVFLKSGGHTAEMGYTLDPDARGRGYATEAVAGLIDYLFETLDVTRIEASLHPDNTASARLLERTGFVHEGMTRSDYWVGDQVSDTSRYSMLRLDRDAWRDRPRQAPADVRLVEIGTHNESVVYKLKTHQTQQDFVAKMEWSYTDALFPEVVDGAPLVPWMRAVEADGELVGFVMVAMTTDHHPEPYLWRLLIDRLHQRRGIGRRVLDLLVDQCREWGDTSLLTSWADGPGGPEPFYLAYGFVATGRIVDDETEARLQLG
ncbi:MAG: GNAT family N-acetyltransferase [Acidimicrobiia bacterium]|nr:GNAT family N-acetyltransferase [Acidimicrobiia bacterium]